MLQLPAYAAGFAAYIELCLMKRRPSHLALEHIWEDEYMLELRVSVDDGLFSGVTQIYTTWESLRDLRSRLQGFPRSTNDLVNELVGEPDGYSYLRLRFRCVDGSGHARAEVEMQKSQQQDGAQDCRPHLKTYVLFEPAAMDNFVFQLDAMISAKNGTANLVGHDA